MKEYSVKLTEQEIVLLEEVTSYQIAHARLNVMLGKADRDRTEALCSKLLDIHMKMCNKHLQIHNVTKGSESFHD